MAATTVTPTSFGAKVRAARRAQDITQTALGRAIGRNAPYICGVEKGYFQPPPEMQKRIAQVLKLPLLSRGRVKSAA